MASTAPLKRKRSGEDLIATIPKRALRPRIPSTRVKKPIVRRAALDLKPATTSPSTNLLLQKDKIIEQLRLELAEAENKLIKTQKRLDEFEKQTSRSPASSQ
ncbi:hypothetical protein E4T44_06919 [Aureobasidium sp. EXF-8845]|nr:hypothetical protein E4T44_06919 [Aureobasidium sp. EXF-8845]KAI4843612.1 hypothetical protein E4T45_08531 [Aureobasidium sp. EXF-8846]